MEVDAAQEIRSSAGGALIVIVITVKTNSRQASLGYSSGPSVCSN